MVVGNNFGRWNTTTQKLCLEHKLAPFAPDSVDLEILFSDDYWRGASRWKLQRYHPKVGPTREK